MAAFVKLDIGTMHPRHQRPKFVYAAFHFPVNKEL